MRICFLTPRFPYPPLKGDILRVYHQLRALSREHEITLLSIAEAPVSAADRAEVARCAREVIVVPLPRWRVGWNLSTGVLVRQPLQVRYYQTAAVRRRLAEPLARERFDVVHATLIRMLPYVWNLPHPPVVVDLIDLADAEPGSPARPDLGGVKRLAFEEEYRRVRAYERAVARALPGAGACRRRRTRRRWAASTSRSSPTAWTSTASRTTDRRGATRPRWSLPATWAIIPTKRRCIWFAAEVWPRLRAARARRSLPDRGHQPDRAGAGPGQAERASRCWAGCPT